MYLFGLPVIRISVFGLFLLYIIVNIHLSFWLFFFWGWEILSYFIFLLTIHVSHCLYLSLHPLSHVWKLIFYLSRLLDRISYPLTSIIIWTLNDLEFIRVVFFCFYWYTPLSTQLIELTTLIKCYIYVYNDVTCEIYPC